MHIRKVPFVGMTGWAVNSIALAVEGSSPFLPNSLFLSLSTKVVCLNLETKYFPLLCF